MPRDLFGDVTRPSISIGSRKWYTVPVSLLSHSLAVGLVIAVPLLAPSMLPDVWRGDVIAYVTKVLPPPPPPPVRRDVAEHPAANPDAAPLGAPTGVSKEQEDLPAFENDHPVPVWSSATSRTGRRTRRASPPVRAGRAGPRRRNDSAAS